MTPPCLTRLPVLSLIPGLSQRPGERLQEAPRPGVAPKFTAEQRCEMAALACEAPANAERPTEAWTGREIADELKARGIVQDSSPRHAARLLKRGLPAAPVPLLVD